MKFQILRIFPCNPYTHQRCIYACVKFVLKNRQKKMKLWWRDNELVLMFLNEKRNKLIFWVHPVPTRGRLLENIMVWSQNWSCIRTYFRMSEAVWSLFSRFGNTIVSFYYYHILCILSKGARFVLLVHLLPNTVILVRSIHWYPKKLEKSIWFEKINATNLCWWC